MPPKRNKGNKQKPQAHNNNSIQIQSQLQGIWQQRQAQQPIQQQQDEQAKKNTAKYGVIDCNTIMALLQYKHNQSCVESMMITTWHDSAIVNERAKKVLAVLKQLEFCSAPIILETEILRQISALHPLVKMTKNQKELYEQQVDLVKKRWVELKALFRLSFFNIDEPFATLTHKLFDVRTHGCSITKAADTLYIGACMLIYEDKLQASGNPLEIIMISFDKEVNKVAKQCGFSVL